MSLFKGSMQWIRDQFTAPDEDDLIDESYDDLYEEEEPAGQAGALPARSVDDAVAAGSRLVQRQQDPEVGSAEETARPDCGGLRADGIR